MISAAHTHFELEGFIIESFANMTSERRVKTIHNKTKSYSQRIPLYLTPHELQEINRNINSPSFFLGTTCSYNASQLIGRNTDLKIPLPFALLPQLSRGYLEYKRISRWNRMGDIKSEGQRNHWQIAQSQLLEAAIIVGISAFAFLFFCKLVHKV